ncbi:RNA-binding domain-containing protein, partial [Delitschia confertaspora ATCC 74209]
PEAVETAQTEEAPADAATSTEEASAKEPEQPAAEEVVQPEIPKEPVPTPAATAPKPAAPAATPAAPPKPAAPRTWASLAASAHKVATPNVTASVTPQAPAQQKAAAPAPAPSQPAATPAAQTTTPAREQSPATSQGEAAGWQTAGAGHKKEQSRVQNQIPAGEPDNKRAYIKNVFPQIEEAAMRSVLSKFGEIEYLDISRPKNCAFVDFKTSAGFQNAVSNNPHTINGVEVRVEERRTRPASFAPFPRGGRGRGGPVGGQPRGGFQARGGRGGGMRGGRPAAQEA